MTLFDVAKNRSLFIKCLWFRTCGIYVDKSGLLVSFPFLPIENDRKWLYQLLLIKYELKLPSEATSTSFAIQNQIQAVCKATGWVGSEKRQFLLTSSTIFADVERVGWKNSKNVLT